MFLGTGLAGITGGSSLADEPPVFFAPQNARPIHNVEQSLSADAIQAKRDSWASAQAALKSSATSTGNNNSGLKWRSSPAVANPAKQAATIQATEFSLNGPANGPAICEGSCDVEPSMNAANYGSVRQVANEEAIDPFNDPFGDARAPRTLRVAQRQPRLAQPIAGISQLNQPTPAAPLDGEPTPAAPRDNQFQADPLRNEALPETSDQPLPLDPLPMEPMLSPEPMLTPAEPMLAPAEPMGGDNRSLDNLIKPDNSLRRSNGVYEPMQPGEKCERMYNERDCCDADRLCQNARRFIRDANIRNISIDITPRFKPDAPSWEEDYASRDETLKNSDSRQWQDRAGNVLVQGRLIDLENGKAVIQSDGGTIQRISMNVLAEDEICFINGWWSLPTECVAEGRTFEQRKWMPTTFAYAASGLCHKPLYFEEVQAERYGHVAGPILQPVLSGAHFFLNVAVLPYKMGINPPTECQYALGYYRPGSCAPWMIPPIPLSLRGAAMQTGAVVGGIYLFP